MSNDFVTYELDGPIALIGLNRPDKRNAINEAVIDELRADREATYAGLGVIAPADARSG